ncbi:hypothetical protein [Streptomyces sp. NBC_01262]|uniref:hypothetical protein n=1 Tax=Streptomyces sp. NBC_01262 TaxID=2903803 RepID=UPI002E349BB7|nr:hypothetical protein [Streptomyces sp. NBC_01262]
MSSPSPRSRLRDALLLIGAGGQLPEAELASRVGTALRDLADEVLGDSSRVELVTVGGDAHSWGWNLGIRLTDYDVRLPDLLWSADDSAVPPQVQENRPRLTQEEWEALLLFSKLVLTVLESEPVPVDAPAGQQTQRSPRPTRSVAREQLCQALAAIAEHSGLSQEELTAHLRSALLDFASETPDNKEAVQHIAVVRARQPDERALLCLSRSGYAIGQVLLGADGCPIPDGVLDDFPDLTRDEWNAVIQVTALTLLAFEAEPTDATG